jgi:hypothetical protein
VTFTPEAQFDPSALEAAVSKVDFTPTGVTVWLRGTVNHNDLPAGGANAAVAWMVVEDSGQRFLLTASDDAGNAAIATASTSSPGSIVIYGKATRAEGAAVTVEVGGIAPGE